MTRSASSAPLLLRARPVPSQVSCRSRGLFGRVSTSIRQNQQPQECLWLLQQYPLQQQQLCPLQEQEPWRLQLRQRGSQKQHDNLILQQQERGCFQQEKLFLQQPQGRRRKETFPCRGGCSNGGITGSDKRKTDSRKYLHSLHGSGVEPSGSRYADSSSGPSAGERLTCVRQQGPPVRAVASTSVVCSSSSSTRLNCCNTASRSSSRGGFSSISSTSLGTRSSRGLDTTSSSSGSFSTRLNNSSASEALTAGKSSFLAGAKHGSSSSSSVSLSCSAVPTVESTSPRDAFSMHASHHFRPAFLRLYSFASCASERHREATSAAALEPALLQRWRGGLTRSAAASQQQRLQYMQEQQQQPGQCSTVSFSSNTCTAAVTASGKGDRETSLWRGTAATHRKKQPQQRSLQQHRVSVFGAAAAPQQSAATRGGAGATAEHPVRPADTPEMTAAAPEKEIADVAAVAGERGAWLHKQHTWGPWSSRGQRVSHLLAQVSAALCRPAAGSTLHVVFGRCDATPRQMHAAACCCARPSALTRRIDFLPRVSNGRAESPGTPFAAAVAYTVAAKSLPFSAGVSSAAPYRSALFCADAAVPCPGRAATSLDSAAAGRTAAEGRGSLAAKCFAARGAAGLTCGRRMMAGSSALPGKRDAAGPGRAAAAAATANDLVRNRAADAFLSASACVGSPFVCLSPIFSSSFSNHSALSFCPSLCNSFSCRALSLPPSSFFSGPVSCAHTRWPPFFSAAASPGTSVCPSSSSASFSTFFSRPSSSSSSCSLASAAPEFARLSFNFNGKQLDFFITAVERDDKAFGPRSAASCLQAVGRVSPSLVLLPVGYLDYEKILEVLPRQGTAAALQLQQQPQKELEELVVDKPNGVYVPLVQQMLQQKIPHFCLGRSKIVDISALSEKLLRRPAELYRLLGVILLGSKNILASAKVNKVSARSNPACHPGSPAVSRAHGSAAVAPVGAAAATGKVGPSVAEGERAARGTNGRGRRGSASASSHLSATAEDEAKLFPSVYEALLVESPRYMALKLHQRLLEWTRSPLAAPEPANDWRDRSPWVRILYGRSRKERDVRASGKRLETALSRLPAALQQQKHWKVLVICEAEAEQQVLAALKEVSKWEDRRPFFEEMKKLEDTYMNSYYTIFIVFLLGPLVLGGELVFKALRKVYRKIKEETAVSVGGDDLILDSGEDEAEEAAAARENGSSSLRD